MKFVSFNVNSIRQRIHQLEAVIDKHSPEVIGLQETKVQDVDFPIADIERLGYHAEFTGQKTHYGVALLSKKTPAIVHKKFSTASDDDQKRFIASSYDFSDYGTITVINGYFPQGESDSHPVKFPAKRKFYADLAHDLQSIYASHQAIIVMGDMNVAPLDVDIGIGEENKKRWLKTGKASFLPEERKWLENIHRLGFNDSLRHIYPADTDLLSWYDYRSRGFEADPRRGLRIDQILLNHHLMSKLRDAGIDTEIRGMEKPSDHCPIWVDVA